jgi:uncharacterized protein (DUF2236 family)
MDLPPAKTTLGKDELERALARLRARTRAPNEGILGPGSASWRVNREAAIFLGAGRALLMQLAHPWVAAAITEHSDAVANPLGRFHRTFATMYTMAFGTLDQALDAARRLHRRHSGVMGRMTHDSGAFSAGSAYAANDAAALLWVHATLVDSALVAHDLVLPPLTIDERERYYAENRLFAALFAIPDDAMPESWAEFARYRDTMLGSDTLTVTPEARAIASGLFLGRKHWLSPPAWYRHLTASMLPARLRRDFCFEITADEQRAAETWLSRVRSIYPRIPERVRFVGPYQEAIARLAGRKPDLFVRGLNRLWIGRVRLASGHGTG